VKISTLAPEAQVLEGDNFIVSSMETPVISIIFILPCVPGEHHNILIIAKIVDSIL
jgi:hypothetical protein